MSIVADIYTYVVGVDTHAATHTYAVVEATGRLVDTETFPTSPAGLDRAAAWIRRRTGGLVEATLIAAEGTGSYGAILGARLSAIGYRVVEAPTPRRDRAGGKNDTLDAQAAARATLVTELHRLRDRRGGGEESAQVRAAMQILVTARDQTAREQTRVRNALTALVRTHELGIDARRKLTATQISTMAAWRTRAGERIDLAVARAQAVRLARRLLDLGSDLKANERQLRELVTTTRPDLLEHRGVGAISAATVLVAWSHPGRVHSEAAFAAIAGTAPIPASSGNTTRHRLNPGGDRRLNRALHTIVMTRTRTDPHTRAYIDRRLAEGKTKREIRRSLKRYTARQLYRALNTVHTTSNAALAP